MNTLARSVLIGGAVVVAIAATIALGRGTPPHQFREKPFDRALDEDLATLAMTSAHLAQLIGPRVVQTESILPIERDPLMMALSEPPARKDVRQTVGATASARRPNDTCAKHNMHKVMIDKYRWRCGK